MSYINNCNPRRMIWFNQHEPKNKMDLWLSYNRHYTDQTDNEQSSEPTQNQGSGSNVGGIGLPTQGQYDDLYNETQTTDNPNQRSCDLILKAWDCGKWVPIVGFNTTSANKIDIVEGNTLYHPAIFTGENPNDLYDAGTLGQLLSNSNFVSQQEWLSVFNSSGFTNAWNYNVNNNTSITIPLAAPLVRGGARATQITSAGQFNSQRFSKVKMYTVDENFYVDGEDVLGNINYLLNNTTGNTLDIQVATVDRIGGVNMQTDTTDQDYRGVPVLFGGPNAGLTYGGNTPSGFTLYGDSTTYNPNNTFLYIPAWALMDVISNPTGSATPEPMIRNGLGTFAQWNVDPHSGLEYCTISLQCTPNVDKGKYLRLNASGTDIEWVDVQSDTDTWRPIQVGGTTIPSGNTLNVVGDGGTSVTYTTSGNVTSMKITSSGSTDTWRPVKVKGSQVLSNSTTGNTLDIKSGDGIYISTETTAGTTSVVIEAQMESQSYSTQNIDYVLLGNILSYSGASSGQVDITGWNIYNVSGYKNFTIQGIPVTHNPIYFHLSGGGNVFVPTGTEIIDPFNCVITGNTGWMLQTGNTYFLTIHSDVLRVEKTKKLNGDNTVDN